MKVFAVNTEDGDCVCQNSVETMFHSLCTTEPVAMMAIDQPDLIMDLLYHHWTTPVFVWLVSDSLTLCTASRVNSNIHMAHNAFFPMIIKYIF